MLHLRESGAVWPVRAVAERMHNKCMQPMHDVTTISCGIARVQRRSVGVQISPLAYSLQFILWTCLLIYHSRAEWKISYAKFIRNDVYVDPTDISGTRRPTESPPVLVGDTGPALGMEWELSEVQM